MYIIYFYCWIIHCMDIVHILCSHQLMDIWVVSHLLNVINNAAMSICFYFFKVYLGIYNCWVNIVLIFWGIAKFVFWSGCIILHQKRLFLSYILRLELCKVIVYWKGKFKLSQMLGDSYLYRTLKFLNFHFFLLNLEKKTERTVT